MLGPNISDLSGDEEIGEPTEPVPPIDPPDPPAPVPPIELPPVFGQDGVIWDPTDSQYVDVQWGQTSCAVVGACSVIDAMTGVAIPESVLVAEATAHDLYDNGSIPENFGKLLDIYEIPYHVNESGAMRDIVMELAYGRKVLVAIDAPELWGKGLGGWVGEVLDWIQEHIWTGGNHAVWVIPSDVSDLDNITVTLNDSGQLEGVGKVYTLEDFIDAAEDSRFHYVATNEAVPGTYQGGGPDPDLAAFPAIEDYYEIRYGEVLPPGDAGVSLAAAESITNQSEFNIQEMRIDAMSKNLLARYAYPFMEWSLDRGLVDNPEYIIREYASRTGVSLERVEELIDRHGFDVVRENYFSVHVAPDIADSLGLNVQDVKELLRDSRFEPLYNRWVSENFREADNVGEVCARFKELGFETQTHMGATYENVVSDVQSTKGPALAVVDIKELKLGDEPLRYFVEKLEATMRWAKGYAPLEVILFVPAVVIGVVETVGAAFDIGGDSPDGFVRVEFGDDFVNVRWPNGEEESFSHEAFERAFEDSRFSYILLGT